MKFKKIVSVILSVIICALMSGCNKEEIATRKFSDTGVYYQGDQFQMYDVSYYFLDISQGTTFSTNAGTLSDDNELIIPLNTAGKLNVVVTARDGKKKGQLKFSIDVQADAPYGEIFNDYMNTTAKKYGNRAVELNKLVEDNYWNRLALLAQHYYPNLNDSNGDNSVAYAWPYTEMVAATWRIASLSNKSHRMERYYRETLEGFKYYLASRVDGFTCYAATRATQAGKGAGDTYYDDNVWIAREFLNAFEVLGDEEYFDTSVAVCEWIWSGWCEPLGGLYWCEQNKTSRNACSNAPAAILFARIYEYTGEQKWLDRAIDCYEWCYETLRDPVDGCYWDNEGVIMVDGNLIAGEIWDRKFTYNTGSMITAGVKLYEITDDTKYLDHAKHTAEGSYGQFFGARGDRDFVSIKTGNEMPWFNVLLLDGYIELYKYDNTVIRNIKAYESSINYAYDNYRSPDGFVASDWVRGFSKNNDGSFNYYKLNILDMAANSENYGQLAHFYEEVYNGN